MKHVASLLICILFFASPSRAETPCDFKGISVGNKMNPAEIMAALGVTKYKTNPSGRTSDDKMAAAKKYGIIAAAELEDLEIGPYCTETSCRVPYGVGVGNNNTPVNVFISFREGLITEIDVSFSANNWNEMLPMLDQKYGADWNVERGDTVITDYVTKKSVILQLISMNHITNGTNRSTNDHCQISAANLDTAFQHHDPYGPYHSMLVIKLVSKNF